MRYEEFFPSFCKHVDLYENYDGKVRTICKPSMDFLETWEVI